MQRCCRLACLVVFAMGVGTAMGADWPQFRGPGGLGVSPEKGLPIEWSATKNIVWRTKLPGMGASSPVTLGNQVFVTCYSGYGLENKDPRPQKDLRRHLLCVNRADGNIVWAKEFMPDLPEHEYSGEGAYQGYAASTPTTDGKHLYVFFGKSGVFCFDLNGKEVWHVMVGTGKNGWGSGASPVLYKNLVIVNASVESGSLIALDKMSGKEVWKAPGIGSAWNTPMVVTPASGEPELVISVQNRVRAFNPDTGKELWNADGIHRYACPSVVVHDGIVYVTGGGAGGSGASTAIKAGGRGDVTKTHVIWREKGGSNVASPIYHEGHLYWAGDDATVYCQDAQTGMIVYDKRPAPKERKIWASPVLADGKLYYVTQTHGTYVVAATPKFEVLSHNEFDDDRSRSNASVAISDGQVFLRTDQYLYRIGKR